MFRSLILAQLLVFSLLAHAQEEEPRTIRVKKESNLVKAQFDNTERRLFAIDRFGNPRDNRIASYTLYVKTRKETRAFRGAGNVLTGEMISYLNKQKDATKIFFTDITVLDEQSHPQKLPDVIEVWFPDCAGCGPGEKKKRRS